MNKTVSIITLVFAAGILMSSCRPEPPPPKITEFRAESVKGGSLVAAFDLLDKEIDRLEKSAKQGAQGPQLGDQAFEFDLTGASSKGPEDAKLTMVVFSDFECPYCSRFAKSSTKLVEQFPEDLRLVFMNYPLQGECNDAITRPFHKNACITAEAGMAANEQGKFWEMHDALFAHISKKRKINIDDIVEIATGLGLDGATIKKAIESEKYKEQIKAQARQLGPTGSRGTPSIFINGMSVKGAKWNNLESVTEFFNGILGKDSGDEPSVAPSVANPGALPGAKVVLADGTRLDDRLEDIRARLAAIKIQTPAKPKRQKSKNPDPNKVYTFNYEKSPTMGPEKAPVTITAFSNFTCPHCAGLAKTLNNIHKEFPKDVRIVFKSVTSPQKPKSIMAHEAAMEALAQGKFWEMHDLIFQNYRSISAEFLKKKAEEIGLDMKKYDAAMQEHKHRQALVDDLSEANKASVSGTPTLFINGKFKRERSKPAISKFVKEILAAGEK